MQSKAQPKESGKTLQPKNITEQGEETENNTTNWNLMRRSPIASTRP
jgi:hypothetical protein